MFSNDTKSKCCDNENECGFDGGHSNGNNFSNDNDNEGCGCGCGCGCGDGPNNKYLTIILEDNSKLECQILGIFGCDGRTYIAALNPIEETVLLFRYNLSQDKTINIEEIDDSEEYEMVSKLFVAMHDSQYEIVQ